MEEVEDSNLDSDSESISELEESLVLDENPQHEEEQIENRMEKVDIQNVINLWDFIENNLIETLYQDISSMLGDVPFFVDGDAILTMIMAEKVWKKKLFGSSLHLIYLIESYLNIFVERGGNFHLIFFKCWENLWIHDKGKLLYRQIFIEHFSQNTNYKVHILNSFFDEEFSELISNYRPEFVLCNFSIDLQLLIPYRNHTVRRLKLIQIIYCLKQNLPCVDCNGIKTDIYNIYAFYSTEAKEISNFVDDFYENFKKTVYNILECTIEKPNDAPLVGKSNITDVREYITTAAAALFNRDIENGQDFLKIFLLNAAIYESLNIKNRSCPLILPKEEIIKNEIVRKNICNWLTALYEALVGIKYIEEHKFDWNNVSDLWQGNLVAHLFRFLGDTIEDSSQLGVTLSKKYEKLIENIEKIGINIPAYPISSSFLQLSWREYNASVVCFGETQLLSIDNPLITQFCKDILHNIKWSDPPAHLNTSAQYTEEHHYHSMKVLRDEYDYIKDTVEILPTDPKEKRRYLRSRNNHAKYMTVYGSSVEGRRLESRAIIQDQSKNNQDKKNEKKNKISKKAQAIIDNNIKQKFMQQQTIESGLLDNFKSEYKKYKQEPEKLLPLINILINKVKSPKVYFEAHFIRTKILHKLFQQKREPNYKKDLFLSVRKVLSQNISLENNQKEILRDILCELNCQEIAKKNNLLESANESSSWIEYQLEHLGPDLERLSDGVPDPRVTGFIPDKWQKELFDIVDRKQSAIIVAPTSSGKTYASYYCMEKVLREGPEGIVVYVSPTKALVNQVAATVYARFKNTPTSPGQSVYGIFTRDFRTYATNCRILVTVPQCLELLLMSPRRFGWVEKLRYVIFDEIHTMVGDIGGIFWERCLMLIRCPFLALSATIREPEFMHNWLQHTENYKYQTDISLGDCRPKNSYKVHLVVHSERHSDLVKFRYDKEGLHHVHPYAALDRDIMTLHNGIPNHMFLSCSETLELYKAMCQVNPSAVPPELLLLNYFSQNCSSGFLNRNMVRNYESALAEILCIWFKERILDFNKTIELLKKTDLQGLISQNDISYVVRNCRKFLDTLREQNMLPAIVFSYNRHLVEYMAKAYTKHLAKEDIVIDRRLMKKSEKEEKIKKKIEHREAAQDKAQSTRNTMKRPELSIINDKSNSIREIGHVDTADIKFIENRLKYAGYRNQHPFIEGLRHGVSYHHSGCNNKMRGAVEMLFRMKVVNLVFATGTLALGIHMPCKTAVIAGNSPYLNAIEYHQMSGRAGRRGFDTVGNVVFFGINDRKQKTLQTALLPKFNGIFPLNVTYVLRLMLLLADITDRGKPSEQATQITISRVINLLENNLLCQQKPEMKQQLKHFLSFSIQYLITQGYINGKGNPLKFCGLITHLHYHEPGNLALVYLLKTGVIRKICSSNLEKEEIQYTLVLILSYLFTTKPLQDSQMDETIEYNNSKVILEPLPHLVFKALQEYNDEVNFVFNQYFMNVATYCNEHDKKLPLSHVEFNPEQIINESEENIDCLHRKFLRLCEPPIICSSFAALSGNNDDNLYEKGKVLTNIKKGICHDTNIVPTINLSSKLNSYALDFFRHGLVSAIVKDNGLKAGEEFTSLKDFMLVIKVIKVSLEEMRVIYENDPVYQHFCLLDNTYSALFQKAFPSYNY